MEVLPDILRPGLVAVFCDTVVGECAAGRGHYYAARGNAFWRLLHESGLTPRQLEPTEDTTLPEYGLGLTDLVARDASADVASLRRRLADVGPDWVAINGLRTAEAVARSLRRPRPRLGPQAWRFAGARVFVLPSSSGANQRREYDGRPSRLDWWAELASQLPRRD